MHRNAPYLLTFLEHLARSVPVIPAFAYFPSGPFLSYKEMDQMYADAGMIMYFFPIVVGKGDAQDGYVFFWKRSIGANIAMMLMADCLSKKLFSFASLFPRSDLIMVMIRWCIVTFYYTPKIWFCQDSVYFCCQRIASTENRFSLSKFYYSKSNKTCQ